MKVFILEDSHSRMVLFQEILGWKNITHAQTVEEGVRLFEKFRPFDLILLDHDLEDAHYGDQQRIVGTGSEFATWLNDFNPECPIIVHSYNPDGARRMDDTLSRAGWDVVRQPFGMDLLRTLEAKWSK
jgi:CheY-like chemotaxis protein